MQNIDNALNKNLDHQCQIEDQKIISLNKFLILSFITFGIYQVWWMFKTWRFFIQKDKVNVMPAVRAVFSIFFGYTLFERIKNYAKSEGYTQNYSSAWMFAGYVIFSLLSLFPDPYKVLSIFYILFTIPAFKALNFAKRQSKQFVVIEQKKFSTAQMIVIVIFSIFWILILLALILFFIERLQ